MQGDGASRHTLVVRSRTRCPIQHRRDEALTERTHFRFGVALQLWPFVKLAQRSSKTSDVLGTATQQYLRYIRECRGEHMSYMTRICSADVDDMESDHLHVNLDSHDLDDSDYL